MPEVTSAGTKGGKGKENTFLDPHQGSCGCSSSRFGRLFASSVLLTVHCSLFTVHAVAGEPSGRKAPQMELKCDQIGETLRCETEALHLELAPPKDADLPKASGKDLKEAYVKGYKRGLQEAVTLREELTDVEHYVWKRPLVQKVWLPPMIVSGVFLPGHLEFVLLDPGAWKLQAPEGAEKK